MTEHLDAAASGDDQAPVDGAPDGGTDEGTDEGTERLRTGVPGVDEVIAAVEELEERPVEEHVGVFETAHDQLRRALDAPGDEPV